MNFGRSVESIGFLIAATLAGFTVADHAAAADPVQVADYVGNTDHIALGVEDNGRVHVLWSGYRDSDAYPTAFYATSSDGATWGAYEVLHTNYAVEVCLVVDDTHDRVHLMYRSAFDGIIHHTVSNGTVSPPMVVEAPSSELTLTLPALAVHPASGDAHALWRHLEWEAGNPNPTATYPVHSKWNGATWSTPVSPLGDNYEYWDTIAVAPNGALMIAGIDTSAGWDNGRAVASYAADGVTFSAIQLIALPYPYPQEDNSVVLTWVPGDGAFHAVTTRFLWPGSGDLYHLVHNATTDSWEARTAIRQGGESTRPHLWPSADHSFSYATFFESEQDLIRERTVDGTALGPIATIGEDFPAFGYSVNGNTKHTSFLDRNDTAHMVLGDEQVASLGVLYQELGQRFSPNRFFADGFESGGLTGWSTSVR